MRGIPLFKLGLQLTLSHPGESRLEERFRIVCRDHIADALRSRMAELKALNYKAGLCVSITIEP